MSFQATVFNVMIASPSDVPVEREIVRKVIHEWNAIHADEKNTVLLPIGWETHSAPDMSGPPQSIINRQVLENSDLLVGIFWTRIGTATKEYASGAVEEIERHIAAGKPAMLYFSEAPVVPNEINQKQYRALEKFRINCQTRALYEPFNNTDEFEAKFRRHLNIRLKEAFFKVKSASIAEVNEEVIPIKILSKEEKSLLKEASKDHDGRIMKTKYMGGVSIQTNRKNFVEGSNPRSAALWISALDSLVQMAYITSEGYKGEVFKITQSGYEAADLITE